MAALASAVGAQRGAAVVTDDRRWQGAGESLCFAPADYERSGYREARDYFHDSTTNMSALLLRLGIPFLDAQAAKSLSMTKVIKLREQFGTERIAFREALELILARLRDAHHPLQAQDLVHSFRAKVAASQTTYKRALRDLWVPGLNELLTISVPTLIADTAAHFLQASGPPQTIAIGAGLVVGACAWWSKLMVNRRSIHEQNVWSYPV